MKCVVPLAGPDLWTEELGWRPLIAFDGEPLLRKALNGRPWQKELQSSDYIFVLREVAGVEHLSSFLKAEWPGSNLVLISECTKGAMFSALAAMSLVPEDESVIVDLADILFEEMDGALPSLLEECEENEMVVPIFESSDPAYSYLEILDSRVVGSREKQVISSHASAGVYAFKDISVYLQAAAWCIRHANEGLTVRGNHFVCPMVNAVYATQGRIIAPCVMNAIPVSKAFHGNGGADI